MKEFNYLGWNKNQGEFKCSDGPVTYSFNLSSIFVKYGMWMDECANNPRAIMVGFDSLTRLREMKKTLFAGFDDVEFPIGEYTKMDDNYYRMLFNFPSKERWTEWYDGNFAAAMRDIAVEYYRKENYIPYNYTRYFVDIKEGDIIHIPENCGYKCYKLNDANPAYTGQALTAKVVRHSGNSVIVKYDELTIPYSWAACYPSCGSVEIQDLFDFEDFINNYVNK